jgi:hypothetical protein
MRGLFALFWAGHLEPASRLGVRAAYSLQNGGHDEKNGSVLEFFFFVIARFFERMAHIFFVTVELSHVYLLSPTAVLSVDIFVIVFSCIVACSPAHQSTLNTIGFQRAHQVLSRMWR